MGDPLDIYEETFTPAPGQVRGAEAPPPDSGTLIPASFRVFQDEQRQVQVARVATEYDKLAQALIERGVPRQSLMRMGDRSADMMMSGADLFFAPRDVASLDREAVWREVQRQRQRDPKAFADLPRDRAEFERNVLRRDGARDADQAIINRAEGVSGFLSVLLGGAGAEMLDPLNIVLMPIGGQGKTVASRVISMGLLGAGIESVQTPRRFASVRELGEEMTWKDAARNITFAMFGSAAFQGVFEVAGAATRRVFRPKPGLEDRLAQALANADPNDDPMRVISQVLADDDPELAAALIKAGRGTIEDDPVFANVAGPKAKAEQRKIRVDRYKSLPETDGIASLEHAERLEQSFFLNKDGELVSVSRDDKGNILFDSGGQIAKFTPQQFVEVADLSGMRPIDPPRPAGGELTPEELGAVFELRRQAEIDEANPYAPIGEGRVQFEDDLTRSLDDILARAQQRTPPPSEAGAMPLPDAPPPAPRVRPEAEPVSVRGRVTDFDMERYISRTASAESSGNPRARASTSSAYGLHQFVEGTWLEFYRKTFGNTGESPEAILAKRADPKVDSAVMETFTKANLAELQRAGFAPTEGNAYLAHFLGIGDALKVLRAGPDADVRGLVNPASIAANREVFKKITSTSELIAWAHRKMGGGGAAVPRGGGAVRAEGEVSQGAVLREEAARLQREAAEVPGLGPVQFDRFDPDAITVDAGLMQFKAGGDEFGVTERLAGVTQWNPFFAGRVMLFETLDGKFIVADGHQRVGLAKRIKAQGDGQRPELDAFVLRESDGWDAETVRTWAALKNIAEGTGTAVDASKVLRGVPREVWQQFLPPRSALVRDAEGLVRLGDDAFGMVVNEVVDPSHAAIAGRLTDDPGQQKALLDLLFKTSPRTIGEADGVLRQAMAAGFVRETQEDMFGTLDVSSSLFLERARVLDRGLAELKKMRQAFGSAARNADTLEAAGNRINREASAREVEDNARAVEIVRRSAWSAGPVKDALDAGAARLAAGDRPADVIRDFVAAVRGLNLDDLARLAGSAEGAGGRGGADGAGRAGQAGDADAGLRPVDGDPADPQLTPEGDPVDPVDGAWPSRAEMEAAGQQGFDLEPDAPVQRFDEPGGDGQKVQIESIEHDLRLAVDDEAAGTLFDIDGEQRLLGDILAEADADRAAIAAARSCLL